jgi:hypothetical protein
MDSGFVEQASTSPSEMGAINYQPASSGANSALNNHSMQGYNSYNGNFQRKIPSRFLSSHSIYCSLCLREIFATHHVFEHEFPID